MCRNALLAELGLAKDPAAPVYLLDLKAGQEPASLHILATRLDQLLADDIRLIVLGSFPADPPVAVTFSIAARKHPERLALIREMDERLEHLVLSGADFQLFLGHKRGMSARLLRSFKYGTLPIVPASLGLQQLVEDYQPGNEQGNGLIFYQPAKEALFDVLAHRAPTLLNRADEWESLRQRAMIHAGRFSWARAAVQYAALYERLKK